MKINKEWHLAHPMPEKPTLAQRIFWHQAHALHCGCRGIPENIKMEMKRRGIIVFERFGKNETPPGQAVSKLQ